MRRQAWWARGLAAAGAALVGLSAPGAASAAEPDLSNAPKIRVVFASPSDMGDRFPAYEPIIQQTLAAAVEQVGVQSAGRITVRIDRRSTAPSTFDIERFSLPGRRTRYATADPDLAYERIRSDVKALLDAHPTDKLLVFADGTQASSVTGTADTALDSQPGPANASNQSTRLAVVHGNGSAWFTAGATDALTASLTPLHEIFHTLGAVQLDAPNTSGDGTGHCRQRYDLMCYELPAYSIVCPRTVLQAYAIDCGGDDYFSVTPTGYLATHWNVANSWFMVHPDHAQTVTQAPVARLAVAPGERVEPGTTVTVDASGSTDDERIARYLFDLDGDGRYEVDNGSSPAVTHVMDQPGTTRTVGVRVVDDAGAFGTAGVGVTTTQPGPRPANQPPLAVLAHTAAGGPSGHAVGTAVQFSSDGSHDPEGGPLQYAWDLDGDEVVDATTSGATRVYGAPGLYNVSLIVTDAHGARARVSALLRVAATTTGTRETTTTESSAKLTLSLDRTRRTQTRRSLLRSGLVIQGRAGGEARVRVSARLGKRTIARGSFLIRRAGTFARTVRLTGSGARTLRSARLPATVTVEVTGGAVRSASRTIRVR